MRVLRARPASCAALLVALLSFVPVALGKRYLGLDHSRVLLAMMCGGRGDDGAILDASFGGGGPLLEEPQGLVLYPTSWLLRVLDVELAASVFVVLHLALAAAAATHLARAKRLPRAHAFAFGVAFAACGSVLDLILHGPYLVGAAGLALTWAGVARLLSRTGGGGVALLALGPALLLLAGELQAFGIALAIVVVEVGAAACARRRERLRDVAHVAGAFVSGALIGGAQPVLSVALASATSRSSRVPDPFLWSLAPVQWLGVVWPGDLIARSGNGSSLFTAAVDDAMAAPPWNLTPFLGAPVLALATVGVALCIWRARRRTGRPGRWRMFTPCLVAVLATLFALGDRTPILGWAIAVVPPLGFFRYPAKYFAVASLALLLLAFHVVALATFSRALPRILSIANITRIALVASAVACAVGVAVAFALQDRVDALSSAVAVRAPWPGEPSLGGLLMSRALFALALALLTLLVAFARPRALAITIALALVIPFARGLPVGEPLTSLPRRSHAAGVPRAADGLVCHGRAIGARHVNRGDKRLGIEGDIIVDWLDLKPNMHQCMDVAVPHAAMASSQGPTFALATTLDETAPLPVQAWALGCTHIATRAPPTALAHVVIDGAPVALPVAGVDAPVFAMRTPALDLAIARTPTLYASGDDALAALSSMRSPEDVANIIDDPAHVLAGRTLAANRSNATDLKASVAWTSTTSGRIKLAGGPGGAVIAVRRPWWPGFDATQGETRVPVVRAAGVQLAVVVDDVTRGDIVLTYRVRNARVALASFVAGVSLLCGVVVTAVRRKKRGSVSS